MQTSQHVIDLHVMQTRQLTACCLTCNFSCQRKWIFYSEQIRIALESNRVKAAFDHNMYTLNMTMNIL